MSPLGIEQVREEAELAGLHPVSLNGGDSLLALSPCCASEMTWRLDEPHWRCKGGCDSLDVASAIYSRVDRELSAELQRVYSAPTTGTDRTPSTDARTVEPDRYAGRRVDIAAMLARPPRPTPWRVVGVVADGSLTILSGESGDGKSWLALALCVGVANGSTVGGFVCRPGPALYIDGEMGREMFVERLRAARVGAEFELRDAMGLDLSKPNDLKWLRGEIDAVGARLVVLDSLRRLTASKAENDSDDMAPTVAALAKLARDTGAAIILIHHKGDGDKFYRGSTAIKDQCDALFGLLRDPIDPEVRRLSCRGGKGKMRYAPEPPDRYLTIDPTTFGIAAADEPERDDRRTPIRDDVKADVLARALPAKSKTEIAERLGRRRNDRTLADALRELEHEGKLVQEDGEWRCRLTPVSLGSEGSDDTGANDAAEPNSDVLPLGATSGTGKTSGGSLCETCGARLTNVGGELLCFGCEAGS